MTGGSDQGTGMEIGDLGLRIGDGGGVKDEGGVMGKREGDQGTGTGYSGGLSSLPGLASVTARPGQLPTVLPLSSQHLTPSGPGAA